MSGVVGVACGDSARYASFGQAMAMLDLPDDWTVRYAQGSDRATGRNRLVATMLDLDAEHILFVDDDHVFSPWLAQRLLTHRQPIVGGLYMKRVFPFSPVAYGERDSDGRYLPLLLTDHDDGLVEVVALGTGAMMIHRDVLLKVGGENGPWFSYGVNDTEMVSEDLVFCERARDSGYRIYVDLGKHARVGHLTTTTVWPVRDGSDWQVGFTVGLGDAFSLRCPIGSGVVEASA